MTPSHNLFENSVIFFLKKVTKQKNRNTSGSSGPLTHSLRCDIQIEIL